MVDVTPTAQAVLDQVLPEVQQRAKAVTGVLEDNTLHSLLDALAGLTRATDAAPRTPRSPHPAEPPRKRRRT